MAIALNTESIVTSFKYMQMKLISTATSTVFFLTVLVARADTLTLAVRSTGIGGTSVSTNYVVPTNVVAQVIFAHCRASSSFSSSILVTINGNTATFLGSSDGVVANLPTVVGPATITLSAGNINSGSGLFAFCTIQTTSSLNFTPSSSVVVPNDAGGPVTILLESSTDLITWTAANPGTYGTTSTNRFFRVRAQR